jgi:hypothetical protein
MAPVPLLLAMALDDMQLLCRIWHRPTGDGFISVWWV